MIRFHEDADNTDKDNNLHPQNLKRIRLNSPSTHELSMEMPAFDGSKGETLEASTTSYQKLQALRARLQTNLSNYTQVPSLLKDLISMDELKKIFQSVIHYIDANHENMTSCSRQKGERLHKRAFDIFRSCQVVKQANGDFALLFCPGLKDITGLKDKSKIVGKGSYKKVKRAYRIDTLYPEVLAESKIKGSIEDVDVEIELETSHSKHFNHPYIIRYELGAQYSKQKKGHLIAKATLFSSLGMGTLQDVIDGKFSLSIKEKAILFDKIVQAVAYMHDQGIVHQDLKPENIILVKNNFGVIEPKIIDFGLCDSIMSRGNACGTQGYLSPELIAFHAKADTQLYNYDFSCFPGAYGYQIFRDVYGIFPNRTPSVLNDAWSLGEIGLELFNLKPMQKMPGYGVRTFLGQLLPLPVVTASETDAIAHIKEDFPIIYGFLQIERDKRLSPQEAINAAVAHSFKNNI